MTRNAVLAALALAVLAAGCAARHQQARRMGGAPNAVPTAPARTTTVRATIAISGVIAPLQNVAITNQLSEPADVVNVNEGDRVRAGQVLAVLDTTDLRAQLAQAQATVNTDIRNAASLDAKVTQSRYTQRLNIGQSGDQVQQARAALASAQSTLNNDDLTLHRDRQLLASGYIAESQYDQQNTQVNNDRSAVRNAQAALSSAMTSQQVNGTQTQGLQAANVASAQADAAAAHAAIDEARASVRQIQASIAKATIVAPADGVVVNRNLNPAEYPGSRTIFTVQQLDRVYAMLNASSADTFAIPVGAPVTLGVSGRSDRTYDGHVVAVLGQVSPGSTDFTVKVEVANPDGKLQSGLPVTATASLPAVTGVGIPTTAFLDDTHTSVMVADDEVVDVVAKQVRVREVASDGKTSIVTGLKPGQVVVTNGQLGLSDGQSLAENG
ncbi:MAG: efflux RND transporter periplasmic adaptor subunit [Candidatus Eremiobacteraeota bacterium]|nr:efflux RND transporter periplasmic adaptor subunit [Candidatus Eremiobacteraeota bacterium]